MDVWEGQRRQRQMRQKRRRRQKRLISDNRTEETWVRGGITVKTWRYSSPCLQFLFSLLYIYPYIYIVYRWRWTSVLLFSQAEFHRTFSDGCWSERGFKAVTDLFQKRGGAVLTEQESPLSHPRFVCVWLMDPHTNICWRECSGSSFYP